MNDTPFKVARIRDVEIVPAKSGVELALKLETQDGPCYTNMFNMITPLKDIATLCDVVGVHSPGDLRGAHIRLFDHSGCMFRIIGNVTDNKWMDLNWFIIIINDTNKYDWLTLWHRLMSCVMIGDMVGQHKDIPTMVLSEEPTATVCFKYLERRTILDVQKINKIDIPGSAKPKKKTKKERKQK